MDFVFFAGDADVTKKYWQAAREAGASIIDLTYALEGRRVFWCVRRGLRRLLENEGASAAGRI